MASVQAFAAIEAPREHVFRLILDQAQRHRFIADGWRVRRLLTPRHDVVTAAMELDGDAGPGSMPRVVQVLSVTDRQVVEGPPAADNYIVTWTVADEAPRARGEPGATLVGVRVEFDFGGFIGEFFESKRLRREYRQMLARLKTVAEATW